MKVKVPNNVKVWKERRQISPSERERYSRDILKQTIVMNPYGVTIGELEEALPLGRKAIEKHLFALTFTNEVYTEVRGGTILYLSNIAGMKEGTKEAISFDGREYDISVIENREGEFVMIRQIEEGDTKGGIIIPKDKFKEFVEFQKRWLEGKWSVAKSI